MEVAVVVPSYATEDARGRPLAPAERLRHPLCSPPAAESAAETLEAEIRQHGRALVPVERLRHEEAAQATVQAEVEVEEVKVTMRASETGGLQMNFQYRFIDGEELTSERVAALQGLGEAGAAPEALSAPPSTPAPAPAAAPAPAPAEPPPSEREKKKKKPSAR